MDSQDPTSPWTSTQDPLKSIPFREIAVFFSNKHGWQELWIQSRREGYEREASSIFFKKKFWRFFEIFRSNRISQNLALMMLWGAELIFWSAKFFSLIMESFKVWPLKTFGIKTKIWIYSRLWGCIRWMRVWRLISGWSLFNLTWKVWFWMKRRKLFRRS